mmetsp:Transcript_44854/g.117660  ORF Transcript_44854/g.117660 Transcript_44854/m.117660 type:complete len:235 (-) Transcript_44854:601-1305(-)
MNHKHNARVCVQAILVDLRAAQPQGDQVKRCARCCLDICFSHRATSAALMSIFVSVASALFDSRDGGPMMLAKYMSSTSVTREPPATPCMSLMYYSAECSRANVLQPSQSNSRLAAHAASNSLVKLAVGLTAHEAPRCFCQLPYWLLLWPCRDNFSRVACRRRIESRAPPLCQPAARTHVPCDHRDSRSDEAPAATHQRFDAMPCARAAPQSPNDHARPCESQQTRRRRLQGSH